MALGVAYALATPPLESSDEFRHYPVVHYVQTQRVLPVLDPDDPGRWHQEAAQPPLYYLLCATLTAWIDTSDLPQVHRPNAHAFIGDPAQVGNKNLILHRRERERLPWQGTVLAVYVIRLASIGLGVGTVLLTAQLGARLFDARTGLFAAALTALNPMFIFVSAAVNNDSLAILLGHWGLYLLVRLWQGAIDPRKHWWRYAGLGVVLGLGMLTKLSLGGLLALTGLALAVLAYVKRSRRLLFLGGIIVLSVALAISGWWFVRNLRTYGDLTALDAFIAVLGTRDTPITWRDWVDEFGTFYRTYWGLFGGINVAAPEPFYAACNVAALAAIVGFAWLRRRRWELGRGTWLLLGWAGLLFALLVRWNVTYTSFQGRLLFPALGAINVLGAVGLMAWVQEEWRSRLAVIVSVLMLVAATALPWIAIRPAYAYPVPLSAVPEEARWGPVSYAADAGEIRLVGAIVEPNQTVTPGGDPVKVVLYWEAVNPVGRDYLSTVHLLGQGYDSVGQINRHPARGMIPTSRWEAGQIWRDLYHVYVDEHAAAPSRLRVSVGLYDPRVERPLAAVGPDGVLMSMVLIGEARLAASRSSAPTPPVPLEVPLAEGIVFSGHGHDPHPALPGKTLNITLYWQAMDTPSRDYTVFVHLLGSDGAQIAGADGPPVEDFYPTSLWQSGDRVEDQHVMSLPGDVPVGTYRIAVGLYDPTTGQRLARLDGRGDSIEWPVQVGADPGP